MKHTPLIMIDFDGTLVDTAPDLVRATNLFLADKGLPALPEKRIREEIGLGLRKLILDVYPDTDLSEIEQQQLYDDFTKVYETQFLNSPTLFDGAYEFLIDFQGDISIVSNKRERFLHPILEKVGLAGFPFRKIIGGDTLGRMKPHPLPFLTALAASSVAPHEALMVGDGAPDVEGAITIGSPCVVVEFGYTPHEELMALGATASVNSFAQLRSYVERT